MRGDGLWEPVNGGLQVVNIRVRVGLGRLQVLVSECDLDGAYVGDFQ